MFNNPLASEPSLPKPTLLTPDMADAAEPYRYPAHVLLADDLRVGFGLSISLGPLVAFELAPAVTFVLIALSILFGLFALYVATKHLARISLTSEGILVRDVKRRFLPWQSLERMRLAYYAPRRTSQEGWFELTLEGGRQKIRLESPLPGFNAVLEAAARAAGGRSLDLDPTTLENLRAIEAIRGELIRPEGHLARARPGKPANGSSSNMRRSM